MTGNVIVMTTGRLRPLSHGPMLLLIHKLHCKKDSEKKLKKQGKIRFIQFTYKTSLHVTRKKMSHGYNKKGYTHENDTNPTGKVTRPFNKGYATEDVFFDSSSR